MCITDNKFNTFRVRMLEMSPYYPETKEVFEPWDYFKYKTDRGRAIDDVVKTIGMGIIEPPQVEMEKVISHIMAITAIVRHIHNGLWYARHHLKTYHLTDTLCKRHPGELNDRWKRLRTEFRRQVYLDLKYGKIDPDIERPMGEPVDPKDTLQVSERERLGL